MSAKPSTLGACGVGRDIAEPHTPDGRFDMDAWKEQRAQQTRNWWGRETLGIDRYAAAIQRAEYAYDNYDNVIVEFSRRQRLHRRAQRHARSRHPPRPPAPARRLLRRGSRSQPKPRTTSGASRSATTSTCTGNCIPVTHRNACSSDSPWFYPWAPEEQDLWVRELPPEGITIHTLAGYDDPGPHGTQERTRPTWPQLSAWLHGKIKGRTASLLGIRANESLIRRRAVANSRAENFVIPGGHDKRVDKIYPIYDWDTTDVWTAPKVHGWDHNRAYDLMEMAGISPHQQRCAPPFGEEPSQSLWQWAICFPDIWEKLCRRVPGASTAARYARTELYAFGDVPDKPAGTPWPEFIRETISHHTDPNTRKLAAQSVQFYIDRHYFYTTDPILEPPHPRTAISWEFLLMIAHRVDTKRRQSMHMTYPKTQAEADAYYDALAEHKAALA